MAVRIAAHPPTEGKAVELYVAILPKGKRTKPTKTTLTATAATKGATALTVSGTSGIIQKGQYLLFVDTEGNEVIVQVTATSTANPTSLTVAPLPEPVTAGMTAEYPVYIWDRKSADLSRSYNFAGVTTFNTGGAQDGLITGEEKTLSLPGIYYFKNAGSRTLKYCADNGLEFWCIREMPAPTDGYTAGDRIEGPAVCTGINDGAPDDNFVTSDFEITFLGKVKETDPVAVA